ncbi:hypothetical protein ACFROC_19380 [Nocardia tengchongensis]|uniref:hypothetical protein n=1 Tax=Nocardia tengchongensis TaxID=2055889 RepID=UPI0036BCAC08
MSLSTRKSLLAVSICAMTISALAACGESDAGPDPMGPLPESLTFDGQIVGQLTEGLNPKAPSGRNPSTGWNRRTETRCSTFDSNYHGAKDDFVADIVGTVAGKEVTVSIEINLDSDAYKNPGQTFVWRNNLDGGAELYIDGDKEARYNHRAPGTDSRTLGADYSVSISSDRKSGTFDGWFDTGSGRSKSQETPVIHVAGQWRCG